MYNSDNRTLKITISKEKEISVPSKLNSDVSSDCKHVEKSFRNVGLDSSDEENFDESLNSQQPNDLLMDHQQSEISDNTGTLNNLLISEPNSSIIHLPLETSEKTISTLR